MPAASHRDRTLRPARRARGVTPRELAEIGIHRQVLTRLVGECRIERIARGVYRLADQPVTENHGLAVPQQRCRKASCACCPPCNFTASARSFLRRPDGRHRNACNRGAPGAGLRCRQDCRGLLQVPQQIGLDVALEALRDAWRGKRFTMAELDRYAAICCVQRVMRPYLEALTA